MEFEMKFPISEIQKQFWVQYKLNPASAVNNIAFLFDIEGNLDRHLVDQILAILVKKHRVLQAYFPNNKVNEVEMVIRQDCYIRCERESFSEQSLNGYANQPFSLEEGPLFRAVFFETQNKTKKILFVFHHIIFDLRSKEIFARDFSQILDNIRQGKTSFEDSDHQYGDYVDWYQKFRKSDTYDQMLSYWKNEPLEKSILNISTDRERTVQVSNSGRRIFGHFPKGLADDLNSYCNLNNTDPFLYLLTVYTVLLHRFSLQNEISIGIPRTNRPPEFLSDTFGCFVNILPLCLQFSENIEFGELTKIIRKKMLYMHRNQYVPHAQISMLDQVVKRQRYNPLFQVGFAFEPLMQLKLNEVDAKTIPFYSEGSQLDFFFYFWNDGGTWNYSIEYNSDLFSEERIKLLYSSFLSILKDSLENSTKKISQIEILSDNSAKIISHWNRTERDLLYKNGIHEYFLETADTHPNKIALKSQDEEMTYGDLKNKALRLSNLLKKHGVSDETIVGLSMERSFDMIIGMYAIVMAGGTYLPIEPSLPSDYLSYIFEDSNVSLVLSKEPYRSLFPEKIDFIPLDSIIYDQFESFYDLPELNPDKRAYILYTSGSTGRPKGVEITHRGLINRVLWMENEYKLKDGDTLFQKTPFNFDVSGWEFWWPLIMGVPLVFAEPGGHKDNIYLKDTIKKNNITIVHFVPSMLREFLRSIDQGDCSSLRHVICSGEALPVALVSDFYSKFSQCRLHNLYGPTEASIDVTSIECTLDHKLTVPIGKPIANTKVFILDKSLKQTPPGVTGEIFLSGTGLARGYLNKPDLTAERFIINPHNGVRMYKTGDLGQWSLEGEILYLGRNDSQIQLHGLRIELGEIENTLNNHPQIEVAAVTMVENQGTDQVLMAYVVKKGYTTTEDLQEYLERHLPSYMVPRRILFVDELKINSNGKLDRNNLPDPDLFQSTRNQDFHDPQGDMERQIAEIWKRMLDLDKVGRNDNFFEIGGSSISIIQMQSELSDKLGIDIPVIELFSHTTVMSLVQFLQGISTRENDIKEIEKRTDRTRNMNRKLKNVRKR